VVRLDGELDHVAVFALAVLLDIDPGNELQSVQIGEAVDAARGRRLGRVVLG